MSKMSLALLSDEVTGTKVSDEAATAAVTEVAEGPDADLAAMDDAAGDIEAAGAVIDEADATTEVLDQVGDKLEEAEKDGGLSAPAAEAIRICLEHMGARLGIAAPTQLAAEGFASKSNRARTTRLAREGVGEWAKKIWDMLVKAYEKVKEFVVKWFKNFFDGATKLKNRAEKLKKAAEAKVTAGAKVDAKDAKIVNPAYGALLSQYGKAATADYIAKALKAFREESSKDVAGEMIDEMGAAIPELLNSIPDGDKFKKAAESLAKDLADAPKSNARIKNADKDLEYFDIYAAFTLGDEVIVMALPKTGDVYERLSKVKVVSGSEGNGSRYALSNDMTAAQPNEVVEIATAAQEVAAQLEDNKKILAQFEKANEGVRSAIKRAKGDYKDEEAKRVKIVASIAKFANTLMVKGTVGGNSAALRGTNAALTYGAESLKLAKAAA